MNPNITWQVIAHTLVGMTIAGTQAAALAFPSDAMLVAICHITAVVVAQLGIGLGVWTVSTGAATSLLKLRRMLKDGVRRMARTGPPVRPQTCVPPTVMA